MSPVGEVERWKESCRRAIKILKGLERDAVPKDRGDGQKDLDTKGHTVHVSVDSTYVFCGQCFVSRRIRDLKWLLAKQCERVGERDCALGESWTHQGHEAVLEMDIWKNTAQRPRWVCRKCGLRWWATAPCKQPCQGS